MKIYISLPISGREKEARYRAEKIAKAIKESGHIPVNPFEISAGEYPDYFDHISADLKELMKCDAIYFDKDFPDSYGCRIEWEVANILNEKHMQETGFPKFAFYFRCKPDPSELPF